MKTDTVANFKKNKNMTTYSGGTRKKEGKGKKNCEDIEETQKMRPQYLHSKYLDSSHAPRARSNSDQSSIVI